MHTVQKTIVGGAQFLFVAFGATVLVPLLIGLEPSVALFTAGVGTLIFHAVTKGKVPILKAFDWRFVWNNRNRLVYGIMSLLILLRGVTFITRLFALVVIGPVIMFIGLSLPGTGVDVAKSNRLLAIIALLTTVDGLGLAALVGVILNLVIPNNIK